MVPPAKSKSIKCLHQLKTEQGWDEHTIRDLLMTFIVDKKLWSECEKWLNQQAEEENQKRCPHCLKVECECGDDDASPGMGAKG